MGTIIKLGRDYRPPPPPPEPSSEDIEAALRIALLREELKAAERFWP